MDWDPTLDQQDGLGENNNGVSTLNKNDQIKTKLTRSLYAETEVELLNFIKNILNYNKFQNENPLKVILKTSDQVFNDFNTYKLTFLIYF